MRRSYGDYRALYNGVNKYLGHQYHSSLKPSCSDLRGSRLFTQYHRVLTQNGSARIDSTRVPQYIGHCTSRNMMKTNEDRYSIGFVNLSIKQSERAVFNASVYDGHGGSECSEYLQQNLPTLVEEANIDELCTQVLPRFQKKFGNYWRSARVLDYATIKNYKRSLLDDLSLRLPLAFLDADYRILEQDQLTGSTCTSVFLYTQDPQSQFWDANAIVNVVVAQLGDTRALISDVEGNVLPLTTVHHADSPMESDRLAQYPQGFNFTSDGKQRYLQYINTRSFGDYQGKPLGITAVPELTEYQIGNGQNRLCGKEAFIVLISDGVTDTASDQEICDIVIQRAIKGGSLRGTPQDAANEILSYVSMLGAYDNATAIVIRLGEWGKWSQWVDRTGKLREDRLTWCSQRRAT